MRGQVSLQDPDFISFEYILNSGILGSYDSYLKKFFWVTFILLSTGGTPVYIPTNRVQKFFFLHILANTCCFLLDNSHSDRCEEISYCGFGLYFPYNEKCGTSFHVPTVYLYAFFEEIRIQILCPLSKSYYLFLFYC